MEDREIVQKLFSRDESGIQEMHTKFERYIKTISYRILHNEEDVEECENDVILGAWNSIPPHQPENLPAYLAKLTRRISISKLPMKDAKKRGSGEGEIALEELEEIVSGKENIEDHLIEAEIAKFISDFLRNEKENARLFFVRRYFYYEKVAEIALRYNVGESQVKMSLKRTREKLAQALKNEGYES